MTEKEYFEQLKDIEVETKAIDDKIAELNAKKKSIIGRFLVSLPFQNGDRVKNNDGKEFIIDSLTFAYTNNDKKVNVSYKAFKVKNDGTPYSHSVDSRTSYCLTRYFDFKKVENN